MSINVYSEIGKLKKVLLHRPGYEVENLTPSTMERLLFDDIPYLETAREEHDAFAEVFKKLDVEVVYCEDLLAEIIKDPTVKDELLNQFLKEAGADDDEKVKAFYEAITDEKELVDKLISGLRLEELEDYSGEVEDHFIVDPMPNYYFSRDPFASMGSGVTINKMATVTRQRETLFGDFIFKYHPDFKETPRYYNRDDQYNLEGGDVLVLSKEVVAIGISLRTEREAVDLFANNIFNSNESFKHVLAFVIPSKRAFMHLDTVFTMVDVDKFTIHPEIEGPLKLYDITKEEGEIKWNEEVMILEEVLQTKLGLDKVHLIRCGGKMGVDAEREQWNDGSNTLAVAPGEVIVYERNTVTNKLLEEAGIKVHKIRSSELSRGRGGPRCMSMPLVREEV